MIKLIAKFNQNKKKYTLIEKLKCTFFYIIKSYLFIFLFLILLELIFFLLDIDNDFKNVIKNKKPLPSDYKLLFNTLLLAPLVEEIIFRLHLKFKDQYFFISIVALIFIIIRFHFLDSILSGILSIYVIILLIIWFLSKKSIFTQKIFEINYILSILFFGLSHIINLKVIDLSLWQVNLFYFVPILIVGYFLSKIRFHLNIVYSIFAHFIFNITPFLLSFLFS